MPQNHFQQRKSAILSKLDKSSKGKWDKKIISLCNKINSLPQYYTTSSCSGRILIMQDKKEKSPNLFKFKTHNLITLTKLKSELKELFPSKSPLKFKQEPVILHIACKTLENANNLLKLAQKAGFKKIGIITLNKRIILEINGSEKLEFPIIKNNQLLVNNIFLSEVIKKSNSNLKKSWNKIEKLKSLV